jgi:ubiquinone/menaquinone biosynthesis C-methylase UbiE
MFSIEFLHTVREHEIEKIVKHIAPGARILEIGGGTGYQAKRLAARGFRVASIDAGTTHYKRRRVFPVIEYDGKVFPFRDAVFDVVFSSSVLEHVADLGQLYRESRRVLKKDGNCLHVMPSAVWRFWESVGHYVELVQRWSVQSRLLLPRRWSFKELHRAVRAVRKMVYLGRKYAVVPRHGEVGNAVTELWTFSRRRWAKHFLRHNFVVIRTETIGLFYTGHMVFGKHWGLRSRERVARVLGSATILYVVKPTAFFHED